MSDKLTPEQLKNWRDLLVNEIGPAAYMIPDEQVQKIRDKRQKQIDKLAEQDG